MPRLLRRLLVIFAMALFVLSSATAHAAEPLAGIWRLQSQEVNGEKSNIEPLTLQVTESGDSFTFAFSVPIDDIYFVTLSYTLRLDGTDADIKNSNGDKIGTIQMRRGGAGKYTLTMKGPNRPDSRGTLSIAADGKTLVSESDVTQAGRNIHSKQAFARN